MSWKQQTLNNHFFFAGSVQKIHKTFDHKSFDQVGNELRAYIYAIKYVDFNT